MLIVQQCCLDTLLTLCPELAGHFEANHTVLARQVSLLNAQQATKAGYGGVLFGVKLFKLSRTWIAHGRRLKLPIKHCSAVP